MLTLEEFLNLKCETEIYPFEDESDIDICYFYEWCSYGKLYHLTYYGTGTKDSSYFVTIR